MFSKKQPEPLFNVSDPRVKQAQEVANRTRKPHLLVRNDLGGLDIMSTQNVSLDEYGDTRTPVAIVHPEPLPDVDTAPEISPTATGNALTPWELSQKVREALDRRSCPDAYMRIAFEEIMDILEPNWRNARPASVTQPEKSRQPFKEGDIVRQYATPAKLRGFDYRVDVAHEWGGLDATGLEDGIKYGLSARFCELVSRPGIEADLSGETRSLEKFAERVIENAPRDKNGKRID